MPVTPHFPPLGIVPCPSDVRLPTLPPTGQPCRMNYFNDSKRNISLSFPDDVRYVIDQTVEQGSSRDTPTWVRLASGSEPNASGGHRLAAVSSCGQS
jgi:hypothetical protein